jgi:ABC-type multidrug transport system ATPase subunit
LTRAPGSPAGLRLENIEKRYGAIYALRKVSLVIAPGDCVVLAGRNGSGKTTLLRVAAGLVRPSSGKLSFFSSAREEEAKVRPGFVAHSTMAYDELTAKENLLLFARLQGVARAETRVEELLGEVGLGERRDSLVRTFSRGMRQRVAIACALLNAPSMLLLDEPATGLDPLGVAWLAETLRRLRDAGCTMMMSLHGESEISSLGTRAIRLDGGMVVADTRSGAAFRNILTFADA